jgi:RimJ/RimL family protein N-acetyltransferase
MVILYPGNDAIDLDDPTDDERDLLGIHHSQQQITDANAQQAADDRKTLLIAVDGTWSQARRMFESSPELASKCHQIQFTSDATTVYDRIRSEPDDYCLSTAEAVAEALVRIEPKSSLRAKEHIHAALERLVQVQLSFESQADPRFTRKKLKAMNKQQERLELEQNLFNHSIFDLGYGALLRPLSLQDVGYVSLVNKDRSVHEIADMIQYHPNYCLGIECNKELVACALRYRSGEIGMLYVDIDHRRKGYASILIQELVRRVRNFENSDYVETFVMDGNDASRATFSALGWRQEDQKKGTGKRKAKRRWVYDIVRRDT